MEVIPLADTADKRPARESEGRPGALLGRAQWGKLGCLGKYVLKRETNEIKH